MSNSSALVVFYRSMASMSNAGVPLLRALNVSAQHCEHLATRKSLLLCSTMVEMGKPFSHAMTAFPNTFPRLHIALVNMGENTGTLHHTLIRLAARQEQAHARRVKLRAALIYPVFVFCVCLAMLLAVPTLLFKNLLGFYSGMGLVLPWPTKLLLALSSPVSIVLGLVGLGALLYFVPRLLRSETGQRCLLATPVVGEALRMAEACELCHTLALLGEVGVPILRALELAREGASTRALKDTLVRAGHAMRQGSDLAGILRDSGCLPPMVPQMVQVGEETGKTGVLLSATARLCEVGLEQSLAMTEAFLQPLMMLFLGLLAGFLVVASMAPMVQLAQSL